MIGVKTNPAYWNFQICFISLIVCLFAKLAKKNISYGSFARKRTNQ